MDKGGWALKVMGREVWLELEPNTDRILITCPELPRCTARADSLDEAVLKIEELILRCGEENQ